MMAAYQKPIDEEEKPEKPYAKFGRWYQ